MLTIAAWLSISNHCVLGALVAAQKAPMHCHGDRPAPSKDGGESTPCCKLLKAIAATKVNLDGAQYDFVLKKYPAGESIGEIWQAQTPTLELDTGPPPAITFSETVLQRSILVHAPPLSLS